MDPFDLAGAGKLDDLRAVLDAEPALAASRNAANVSLLAWAHYTGHEEAAPLIRAHLGALDPFDAIIAGELDGVQRALDSGWDGNALSPDGFTPLGLAAFLGRRPIFDLLLPITRDVNQRAENRQQVAALHAAVSRRSTEMVDALLRAGADPDRTQAGGFTPLHVAAAHGDTAIVAMLLLFGADPGLRNDKGETAIDHARQRGHDWLARRLESRA